jgi:RNA 2',3'-cyclic 3'-phosphodiesterase
MSSTSLQQVRAFIAVDVGPDVRAVLRPVFEQLKRKASQVRWVPEDQWHLTAKFLGDVDGKQVAEIAKALQEEARATPAFDLEFRGLKPFPPGREPRIVAVEVVAGIDALAGFHRRLDQRMQAFGVPSERRGFLAHLTVGRIKGTGRMEWLWDYVRDQAEANFGMANIDEAILFQSNLRPEGPQYIPLAHAPMGS